MKIIVTVIITLLGAVVMSQTLPVGGVKPAKQEIVLPEQNLYSRYAQETVKAYQSANYPQCPRNDADANIRREFAESVPYEYKSASGEVYQTRHCVNCGAGVYVFNENKSSKHCSFCHAQEVSDSGE